jgi:sirohydrochlorin cobaltochelatase
MSTTIVLAMHGAPPVDFPGDELAEFFGLHMRLEHGPPGGEQRARLEARYAELEEKVRTWPRTPQNDPFYAASLEMAAHLEAATGSRVVVGFNEFCSPTLDEALDEAAAADVQQVVVVTPMMTRGGEHAERDIPAAIDRARAEHTDAEFLYAWPFEAADVAAFLAGQIERWLGPG